MSFILAHKTNSLENALVISGKLEAVGFTPFIKNYYHTSLALGYHLALDGFHILLPHDQVSDARSYMNENHEILDHDPIPSRLKRDIIQASIITTNPFFGLWLIPPIFHIGFLLVLITFYVKIGEEVFLVALLKSSAYAVLIAIIAHARYVALPKLRHHHDTSR